MRQSGASSVGHNEKHMPVGGMLAFSLPKATSAFVFVGSIQYFHAKG
jgi:hypothetical protein